MVNTSTVVDGQTLQIFRGSFSHTYASADPQTITVNSVPFPNPPLVAGNTSTYNGVSFVTNTAAVFVGGGEALPIPTVGDTGMILLALLLAGAALVLLRR